MAGGEGGQVRRLGGAGNGAAEGGGRRRGLGSGWDVVGGAGRAPGGPGVAAGGRRGGPWQEGLSGMRSAPIAHGAGPGAGVAIARRPGGRRERRT